VLRSDSQTALATTREAFDSHEAAARDRARSVVPR
jgi:hypothetical protein